MSVNYIPDKRRGSFASSSSSTDDEKSTAFSNSTDRFAHEQSKAAIHHSAEIISYFVHSTSLCLTGFVLQLSFRGVYWADEDSWGDSSWSLGLSQPVMAGVLQFCAKLHEIFILASLSAIVIDIIRRRLLVSLGMPFGFLMGGYRFGESSFLFSGSFWGPFLDAIRRGKIELFALGLLLGLGAIYTNAIGPASAVLIVPTLSWWPAYELPALMIGEGAIYPSYIPTTEWMSNNCVADNDHIPFGCPNLGASDLINARYFSGPGDVANRSFTQRYGKARRNLYTSPPIEPPGSKSALRISSTIHSIVLEAIGLGGRFVTAFSDDNSTIYNVGRPQLETIDTDSGNVKSPLVQAECASVTLSDVQSGKSNLTFPTNLLIDQTPNDPGLQLTVPEEYWPINSHKRPSGGDTTNFTWIDVSKLRSRANTSRGSIGAIAAILFPIESPDGRPNNTVYDFLLAACVLDARWAASKVTYNPTNSDLVDSNITDLSVFNGSTFEKGIRKKYGVSDPAITIDTDWANLLNGPLARLQDGTLTQIAVPTYLDQLQIDEKERNATYRNVTSDIAKFLGLTLADGISRVATQAEQITGLTWDPEKGEYTVSSLFGNGYFTATTNSLQNIGIGITFKVERYGWGYGIETKTARFAVAILFIHAVVATVYMIFTIAHWFIYRWSSHSWKNMDQLFALAMVSSQPSSLRGVSAGIGTWDTWKLEVAIREDEELHDRIELAFGGRDGGPVGRKEGKIRWRKRYR